MSRLPRMIFVLAIISACGGDNFQSVRNLRSSGEAIICFGDSLTEGVGAIPGEDYPTILSRQIGFPVINAGQRGDTTGQALARLADDVLNRHPRLVIVLLGGNDFLRQLPRSESRKNLAAIVQRIQQDGAMVIIAGIKLGFFTDEFAAIYEETAKEFGALYIPQVMHGILSDARLRSDPIHPNGAGYRLIAERIAERLKPLLHEADHLTGRSGF
jgi:acyl-CoA thioesterase-1